MADTLLYAIPSGGHPYYNHALSVRGLELSCTSFERRVGDCVSVRAPVQMARTQIAELAMRGRCNVRHRHDGKSCKTEPYDYVLMHDDDVMIGPQFQESEQDAPPLVVGNPMDVWHSMMLDDPKIGVIGALYMRETPMMPNVAVFHPVHRGELVHVVAGMPPEPFEVGALGTGFMMVRVSVLRELAAAEEADGCPPLFRFPLEPTEWGMIQTTGEDYDFCKRVNRLGYKVLADPRWPTIHVKERGPLVFSYRDWEGSWAHGVPASLAEEYRSACPPTFKFLRMNGGLLVIDHTAEREKRAEEWRRRTVPRQREAA